MKGIRNSLCITAMLLTMTLFSCAAKKELSGAGATFPYPLYSKMFDVYQKEYGGYLIT